VLPRAQLGKRLARLGSPSKRARTSALDQRSPSPRTLYRRLLPTDAAASFPSTTTRRDLSCALSRGSAPIARNRFSNTSLRSTPFATTAHLPRQPQALHDEASRALVNVAVPAPTTPPLPHKPPSPPRTLLLPLEVGARRRWSDPQSNATGAPPRAPRKVDASLHHRATLKTPASMKDRKSGREARARDSRRPITHEPDESLDQHPREGAQAWKGAEKPAAQRAGKLDREPSTRSKERRAALGRSTLDDAGWKGAPRTARNAEGNPGRRPREVQKARASPHATAGGCAIPDPSPSANLSALEPEVLSSIFAVKHRSFPSKFPLSAGNRERDCTNPRTRWMVVRVSFQELRS
jgi:hypothetical protein